MVLTNTKNAKINITSVCIFCPYNWPSSISFFMYLVQLVFFSFKLLKKNVCFIIGNFVLHSSGGCCLVISNTTDCCSLLTIEICYHLFLFGQLRCYGFVLFLVTVWCWIQNTGRAFTMEKYEKLRQQLQERDCTDEYIGRLGDRFDFTRENKVEVSDQWQSLTCGSLLTSWVLN